MINLKPKPELVTTNPGLDPCIKTSNLIRILNEKDLERIENFTEIWNELREHISHCNACQKLANKLDEKYRNILILWLSMPPGDEPLRWDDLSPSFVVDARKNQIELVNNLWDFWQGNGVFPLQHSLDGMDALTKEHWIYFANQYFSKFSSNKKEILNKTDSKEIRLDIVSAFGSFIDKKLILQDCDIAQARVLITFENNESFFEFPDGTRIKFKEIVKTMAYRINIEEKLLEILAECISISLPAHREVLPEIYVDKTAKGCELYSLWKDPLS